MRIHLENNELNKKILSNLDFLKIKKTRNTKIFCTKEGLFELSDLGFKKIRIHFNSENTIKNNEISLIIDRTSFHSGETHFNIPYPHLALNRTVTSYQIRPNCPLLYTIEKTNNDTQYYFYSKENHNNEDIFSFVNEFLCLGTNLI